MVEALAVEDEEYLEEQCRTEEAEDSGVAGEQPVLVPTTASGRPNFAPSAVPQQK